MTPSIGIKVNACGICALLMVWKVLQVCKNSVCSKVSHFLGYQDNKYRPQKREIKIKCPAHVSPFNGSEEQPTSSFYKKYAKVSKRSHVTHVVYYKCDTCRILQVLLGFMIGFGEK